MTCSQPPGDMWQSRFSDLHLEDSHQYAVHQPTLPSLYFFTNCRINSLFPAANSQWVALTFLTLLTQLLPLCYIWHLFLRQTFLREGMRWCPHHLHHNPPKKAYDKLEALTGVLRMF